MKKIIVLFVVLGVGALQGLAGFKISKTIYRMNDLQKAKAEASSKGKPITFVYTTTNSSCRLCANASLNAIDRLKTKTVVVYVNYDTDRHLVPKIVRDAVRTPQAGSLAPKTIIVDPGITKVISTGIQGHTSK